MDQDQTSSNDPYNSSISPSSSLMEYAYLLWRWVWLILLAGLLAGGTAYLSSSRTIPTYQTSTRLFISVPSLATNVDSTGLFFTYNMTTTYAQMLTDYPVLQGVLDKLKLDVTPEMLRGMIKVTEIKDLQLISISVSGTNPGLIVEIANTLSAVFAERISSLQSQRYAASREALKVQVDEMSKQVEATTQELAGATDETLKLETQTRLTQYRQLYASLVSSYEQVRMAEAQNTTNVVVSDPARNASQTGPKTARNTLLALAAGMLLAAGLVFAIDALDDSIKNPEEIRRKFGLPILGVIARHTSPEGRPAAQAQPRSPVSESFRALRTNVKFASVDVPLRRVLITSPTPQDGKTTVAANLAVVIAQGEKQVMVVDADLRRPQMHLRFGLPNRSGLSDLLVRPLDELDAAVQSTGVPGLKVVTSGPLPPNPAELLGSNKMAELLERLAGENDLVLVDTPPILSVTDAAALAPGVDGVILVAKPGATKVAALQQAVEQLQAVGARILGVVLNEVEPGSRRYGYYYRRYYSKYSYYYSASGEKVKKVKKDQVQA